MAFFSIQNALLLVHVPYFVSSAFVSEEASGEMGANGQLARERLSAVMMQHIEGKIGTGGDATLDVADSTSQCIAASVGLIGPTTNLVMSFVSIEEKCKDGPDDCAAAAFAIVAKLRKLTEIILSNVVPRCDKSGATKELNCSAAVVAENGPVSQIEDFAESITNSTLACGGEQGLAMFNCLNIGNMATEIFQVVQTILTLVERCDQACINEIERGSCDAKCPIKNNGEWTCRERVNYLFTHENRQHNAAIQQVNAECCHACQCSSGDFTCLPENERGSCGDQCGLHTCEDRVKWLIGKEWFPTQKAVDAVNYECCNSCMCSVDEIEPCDWSCELEGQEGSYSCAGRIKWSYKHSADVKGDKEAAIDKVNKECRPQCECTLNSSSLQTLR